MAHTITDTGWKLVLLDDRSGRRWLARTLVFSAEETMAGVMAEIMRIKAMESRMQVRAHFSRPFANQVSLRGIIEGI